MVSAKKTGTVAKKAVAANSAQPVAKKAAAKPAVKKAAAKPAATDKIPVSNISNHPIPVSGGRIMPGEEGTASVAECSVLHEYIQRI